MPCITEVYILLIKIVLILLWCTYIRTVVRRQEMLQKYVEKCEEILSAKSEAKEALAKAVSFLF